MTHTPEHLPHLRKWLCLIGDGNECVCAPTREEVVELARKVEREREASE